MSRLKLEGQQWTLETGEEVSTRDIFERLTEGRIDRSCRCRPHEQLGWIPVGHQFRFIGSYGLLDLLGQGSFGAVYLGFHAQRLFKKQQLRLAALKIPTKSALLQIARYAPLGSQLSSTEHQRQGSAWARKEIGKSFAKEALVTARMNMCAEVVHVLEYDADYPYIVFDYCDGGSLATRLQQPYTLQDVVRWGREIATALNAAHSLKPDALVHRDLKPDNILLSNGLLKIADLGTSQMLEQTRSIDSLRGGYTPAYAAPEAFDGKASIATDVWSLGVILYEALAGERPFRATGQLQLLKRIALHEPQALSEIVQPNVPRDLTDFVHRCLIKDPRNRPPAEECLDFLKRLEPRIRRRSTVRLGSPDGHTFSGKELLKIYDLLKDQSLFDQVAPETLGKFLDSAPVLDFKEGDMLIRHGELEETALLLIEGHTRVSVNGVKLAERGPGEVLGELSLLDSQPRSANVRALEHGRALLIEKPLFNQMLEESPEFSRNIINALVAKLRGSVRDTEKKSKRLTREDLSEN